MHRKMRILALIPARGGSKGLPGKNIKVLAGKPLLAWSIRQARECPFVDRVIVSTDSRKIAGVARRYGADVPFLRPRHLATDRAKTMGAILHALDWLEQNGERYDLLLLLQPTSPLRASRDIAGVLRTFFARKAAAVVSVTRAEHPPLWTNTLPRDGCMKNFLRPEILGKNRQELPVFYRLNGAVYLADVRYLKKTRTFFGKKTFAYVMPPERSTDIDTETDFRLAEIQLKS